MFIGDGFSLVKWFIHPLRESIDRPKLWHLKALPAVPFLVFLSRNVMG
jgi:hypothetical protein